MSEEPKRMSARPNPPLVAARSFEAAARHLSFQRAADELNVTPTAISHQVRRLEEYMGQALFLRLNRAVELTSAGAALALTLGELFTRLECVLDPVRTRGRDVVRISAMQSLAAKWLAPRLPQFEALHPQWRVEMDVEDKLVEFDDGQTDLALRYGTGKYAGLTTRSWMPAPIFPVCSPALLQRRPLAKPADLRHHTLIHYEQSKKRVRPPGWAEWLAAQGLAGIDAGKGPRFATIYMALEAAQEGNGVTLVPAPLVERDLAMGRLVRPFGAAMEMPSPYAFWIVCPRPHLEDAGIKALAAWLQKQARAS
jgi:LysR family glycine cleavage system transcriptional activator